MNDTKCPYCEELWDRDFICTDVEGDTHPERVRRFQALGCNAFRDGWDTPCGTPAPTPLADFIRAANNPEPTTNKAQQTQ